MEITNRLLNTVASGTPTGEDLISKLPIDILFSIAQHLSSQEILKLCRMSKAWNMRLCSQDYGNIWKSLYERDVSSVTSPLTVFPGLVSLQSAVPPEEPPMVDLSETARPTISPAVYRRAYQKTVADVRRMYSEDAIAYALKRGFEKLLYKLLRTNHDVNVAMVSAAVTGRLDIIEHLIELGGRNFDSTMAVAAKNGHRDIVNAMLRRGATDINWTMSMAADSGYLDIVNQMLKLGATDVDKAMETAAFGGYSDIVKRMIDAGATNFKAALEPAIEQGQVDVIELLVNAAHLSQEALNNLLIDAVYENQIPSIRKLIDLGAMNVRQALVAAKTMLTKPEVMDYLHSLQPNDRPN